MVSCVVAGRVVDAVDYAHRFSWWQDGRLSGVCWWN